MFRNLHSLIKLITKRKMATITYNPNFNESSWYRSCRKEIFNPIYGKSTGTIPSWLNGVLIRNGPGLFEFGTTTVNHVFDGMALLHRFEIQNGVVSYQCRFLQSDIYKKNTKANRIVVTDFGTKAVPDPCQTIFSRISSMFHSMEEVSDNATISVYPFGDEIYAFSETGIIHKVDDSNLETKTKRDFRKQLGIVTHTSHPHVVEDGTVYNLALSFSNKGPLYHIVCFPNKEKTDADHAMFDEAHVLASIPSKWRLHPSYMHSFGVTENYFIIVEQPMTIEIPRMLLTRIFVEAPANDFIRWYNNETTKFLVISRKTGELVKTFYANGFFYFHTINQYEDMNHIIIDICTYKDGSVFNSLYMDALKNAHSDPNFAETFKSTPQRFVLPLSTEERTSCNNENLVQIPNSASKAYIKEDGNVWVEQETICDHFCEMPTFNYNQFLGKKYQYFYGLTPCAESTNPSTLVKADIENKISKLWSEKGCYPSEAIFVSKPNPKSEDDGVILSSLIYAEDERRISLLVLDAQTFEEIGRVQFVTESPVPRNLHGIIGNTVMEKYNPHFDATTWSRSCNEEIISPIYGKVTGSIPSWLNGVLIRNGPGLFHFGNTEITHMFDGMALLHRFEIQDGVASYQCRFIQSDIYKKNTKANRIVVTDFGTTAVPDPCQSIFHRISSAFNFKKNMPDNAVISVYPFGDEIYAFAETAVMYRVNHKNLETIRKIDFKERWGVITHTSHPQVLKKGNVYNLGLSFSSKGPQYLIVCFPSKPKNDENDYSMFEKAHIVASIPCRWKLNPSYMHSFGITENYFIIIEQPISLSISKLLLGKIFADAPVSKFMEWYKDEMTRFIVVSRHTGELRKEFYAKGFFYFHTINQYEHLNHIVIDICTYEDCSILNSAYLEAVKNARMDPNFASTFKSYPTRFVLPLSVTQDKPSTNENLVRIPNTNAKAYIDKNSNIFVESELICDTICDMPTIFRDEFLGKDYQYFYGLNQCTADTNPSALVKVNVKKKTCKSWFEKHCYPSEPIFVPKPNCQGEDDGVVLSSLIWGENEKRVSLLVLDAKTFEELGRVEFETKGPVPRTIHGWYLQK